MAYYCCAALLYESSFLNASTSSGTLQSTIASASASASASRDLEGRRP